MHEAGGWLELEAVMPLWEQTIDGLGVDLDIERIIAGAKFMIRPNVSVNVEGAYYTEGENLEEGFDQTIFVLLSASF